MSLGNFTDTGRHTYEGLLTVVHIPKRGRGKGIFAQLVDEVTNPRWWPPEYILRLVDHPKTAINLHPNIKLTSLPRGLEATCAGRLGWNGVLNAHRVRVTVTVKPYHNGLGGYGSRAVGECLEDHEVTLPNPPFPPPYDPKKAAEQVLGTIDRVSANVNHLLGRD